MTRNLCRLWLWLLLLPLTSAVHAAPPPDATTGNDLLRACGARGYGSDFWFCQGYLAGLHQTVVSMTKLGALKPPYCTPLGFTNRQLRNVVVAYLWAYREQLDQPAEFLVLAALSTAYPCAQR